MGVPKWKKWLSYLWEVHVESASTSYNPHIYVSLKNGRYQLSTANAVYSYGDLYLNFYLAFRELDFHRLPGREALILGLGLGSIPYMLERKFEREFRYTAVEVDETVAWWAHQYVLQDLRSPVEVITTDAMLFMKANERQYDLICMDVFDDDQVPEEMQTRDFLQMLEGALSPGGLLLFNKLFVTVEDRKDAKAFFDDTFLDVFPDAGHLDLGGNRMLANRMDLFRDAGKNV